LSNADLTLTSLLTYPRLAAVERLIKLRWANIGPTYRCKVSDKMFQKLVLRYQLKHSE